MNGTFFAVCVPGVLPPRGVPRGVGGVSNRRLFITTARPLPGGLSPAAPPGSLMGGLTGSESLARDRLMNVGG